MSEQLSRSFGTENQLLFDDERVADKLGFTLTLNPPTRGEALALEPEREWETRGIHLPSVAASQEGVHRMYYSAAGDDEGDRVFCCATSTDGIHWERPDLGLVDYGGNRNNNILMKGTMGSVFLDPNAVPEERYKLIGQDGSKWGVTSVNCGGARFRYYKGKLETWEYGAIIGAHSPDGIHWTRYPEPIIPWYSDTQNVAFWDDRIGRYVAYVRLNEHLHIDDEGRQVGSFDYRTIARAESDDFTHFPEPTKVEEPDFTLPEDEDQAGGGLYNTGGLKYPGAADSYFIFPSAYHHTSDTLDIQLATSRDGIHFNRWLEPFVRLGTSGRFDSRGMYMAPGMIPAGDEVYLYYGGVSTRHDIDVGDTPTDRQKPGLGRLRLRRDGFVSQDAGTDEGWLTTVPFTLEGSRLQVNMDASSRGWLKVEILDETGHALWGYAKAEADRLMFNDLAQTVTWEGRADLSALQGRSVRLRFIGHSVKLFSFQLKDDS